jgi:ABC-2 type transport system ATP-binding protein
MLGTLLVPDGGSVRVAGIEAVAEPQRVSAGDRVGRSARGGGTGRENLDMVARLFGLSRRGVRSAVDEVLVRLGLGNAASRRGGTCSGGMRRLLDLGASLVGRPRLPLPDEPTTGLGPRSPRELWSLVRELVASGPMCC